MTALDEGIVSRQSQMRYAGSYALVPSAAQFAPWRGCEEFEPCGLKDRRLECAALSLEVQRGFFGCDGLAAPAPSGAKTAPSAEVGFRAADCPR